MKYSILFLLLSAVSLLAGDDWPGVKFTEVRAYAWPYDEKIPVAEVILDGFALKDGAINKEGALLTADQIKRLRAAVIGERPARAGSFCYIPHNAFVFYDADKKPVAYLEVCLSCLGARSKPEGTARWKDYKALAIIMDELKLPLGAHKSLKEFQERLEEFESRFHDSPAPKSPGARK